MSLDRLLALSPLDGRYAAALTELAPIYSEFGLIRARVAVEIGWLLQLADEPAISPLAALGADARAALRQIAENFTAADAQRIKTLERTLNHDVKAVEYFLRERTAEHAELSCVQEFLHFACTSEDINNLAYGLLFSTARERVLLPAMAALIDPLRELAHKYADWPLLARTHGQPASPTTAGKELANFVHRLVRQRDQLAQIPVLGKMNGAVGNYNAHVFVYPEIDWPALAGRFITGLGLVQNPYTTQIEPHDNLAELLAPLARFNAVALDLCRDLWAYISLGYFRQRVVAGEVGSSTMPHKVNPIDFENAEGNLGIANALIAHCSEKLPVSRWQRDLSDSTVLRNLGVALGHAVLAWRSAVRGLGKLEADRERLTDDLNAHYEVLAEAVQTLLRRLGADDPYAQLKALTRGAALDAAAWRELVTRLDIPDAARRRLQTLTPAEYTGLAAELARRA